MRLATDGDVDVAKLRCCRPAAHDARFERDVIEGLSAPDKSLPCKYFYDDAGSRLFEAICATPEYYPTRVETALLRDVAGEVAALIPPGAILCEFGSGASTKTRALLDAAPHISGYAPIDISASALAAAASEIARDYPGLEVRPLHADFTALLPELDWGRARPMFGFFPGSTIGNMAAADIGRFLTHARAWLREGGRFLLGVDLVKDEPTLRAAYDDNGGVTAAFNLNLLRRINRELGGDFDLAGFRHIALWNADARRMEMRLELLQPQSVRIGARQFEFSAGETIHTENCWKVQP